MLMPLVRLLLGLLQQSQLLRLARGLECLLVSLAVLA